MNLKTLLIVVFSSVGYLQAQTYTDYIGAGHSDGITVTTSSSEGHAIGDKTINGNGLDADLFEASRFLSQATFGASLGEIEALAEDMDFEAWIDNQVTLPQTEYLQPMWDIWDEILAARIANGEDPEDIFGPWAVHWNYTWWQNMMDNDDQLRQRVALALSEICVISINSDIRDWAWGMSDYYDMLMTHSFGNYKDLLKDVSLHPIMGYYLSHLNNSKAIPEENIHPDENYAREIMQLFSIGLYELNLNGTEKLDVDGNPIPTYDNDDIKELAKVFTGLGPGGLEPWVDWTDEPYFGLGIWGASKIDPMVMYQDDHETEEKVLLGTYTIPANQPGMQDVDDAIDFLFNHDNVAPFVAYRLIQRFVTSNPSPDYVERVAMAFEDDGNGVRGDMVAVIKAVLLDEEARSCNGMQTDHAGKLRTPTMKYTQVAKGMALDSPLGRYWNNGFNSYDNTLHHPLMSPTVFNFYLPAHQPVGELSDLNLVAPEFKLHNTSTATSYINQVNAWTNWDSFMNSWEGDLDETIRLLTDVYEDLADDPETMINAYDIIFTHGQLTDETRQIMREAVEGVDYPWQDDNIERNYDRARLALYFMLISPDYNITK